MPVGQIGETSSKVADLQLKCGVDVEALTLLGVVKAIPGTSASFRVRFECTACAVASSHKAEECGSGKLCVADAKSSSTAPSQIRTPAPIVPQ